MITGTVEQILPKGMYLVVLDGGKRVRAGLTPSSRHSMVRLLPGDRVELRTSPTDPSRGQITKKL